MKIVNLLNLLLIVIAFFTFTAAATSGEVLILDIGTALEMALQGNLGLRSERIEKGTIERALNSSWNEYLPGLSFDVSSNYINESERLSRLFPDTSPLSVSAGLAASMDLTGTKKQKKQNLLLEYEAVGINVEEVENQLIRDVRKSFYYLLLLQEGMKIIHESIDTARQRYDQARINYENGLVSELTVLNTLITLENFKQELENEKVAYRTESLQFIQLLGFDGDAELKIKGAIDFKRISLDANSLIENYAGRNLSVLSLRTDIELLENQKRLTQLEEFTPAITLSSSLKTSLTDPFQTNVGNGENWIDGFTLRFGVSVPLDGLIPSSKSRISVQESEDSINKANLELEETLQLVLIDIETSVLNLEKSVRSVQSLEESVVLAQRVYNLTEEEYNAGVIDLLALEDANDKLLDAKFSVLAEEYNYLSNLFDLEYTLNTTINGQL